MNIYTIGISISFILYIILGSIISTKVKSANDFYVAGRRAPVLLITGSMIASYVIRVCLWAMQVSITVGFSRR